MRGIKIRNQALVLIFAEVFFIITSVYWERGMHATIWYAVLYFSFFTLGGYALARDKNG